MKNLTEIQKQLIENIKNQNVHFVFPTDVVKNSWIDWIVMNPELSGVNTVELQRFLAWDNFKGECIKTRQEGKSSVPSLMRKFFVRNLICENAKNSFLKKIINPDFADNASSFTDWICKILPSLHLWHEKYTNFIKTNSLQSEIQKNDAENQDYLELYRRYSEFLDKNDMFEPSWIEPNFNGDENLKFIIFYPEILEDYADYIEVFNSSDKISVINLPPEQNDFSAHENDVLCHKFADARQEMRRTILLMRKLVHPEEFSEKSSDAKSEIKNDEPDINPVAWNEISLSVPNLQVYRPYLERELKKYNVPFVIREGLPLTTNCAGQIFSDIYECYSSNFSYDSVRALLQNEYVPWNSQQKENQTIKSDVSVIKENLIREGNQMRCIFGYNESDGKKIDIWEEALSIAKNDDQEKRFYSDFKKNIISLCQAENFENIKTAWLIFKENFLDENDYTKEANDILGHCITKLDEMIQIEKEYGEKNNFILGNHYEFFLNELKSKSYTPQDKTLGLNVYPYKLSAAANFRHQFVINASQKNLEVPFKRLSFLSTEKRSILGLLDEDKKFNASHSFIRLYNQNNCKNPVHFSYCEDSFDGFAIAHTYLKVVDEKNPLSELDKHDFYLNEKDLIMNNLKTDCINSDGQNIMLTLTQKESFLKWAKINSENDENYVLSENVKAKIHEKLISNRQKNGGTKYVFTQDDMKRFFPCPRKWVLSSVLKLKEDSLDTDLMKPYDMGNINHKILEEFMNLYKEKALPVTDESGKFDDEDAIFESVRNIAKKVVNGKSDLKSEIFSSPLVMTMLNSQIDSLTKNIMNFLHSFCKKNSPKEKINTKTKTDGFGGYIVKEIESQKNLSCDDFDLFGKIDLVLVPPMENDETEWTIIDYKNSKSSIPDAKDIKVKDNQTLGDFQMPMYITLLTKTCRFDANDLEKNMQKINYAGFWGISDLDSRSAVDSNKKSVFAEDYIPTMGEFSQYLKDFKNHLDENDLEPKSFVHKKSENGIKNHFDVDLIENCKNCQFNSICRYNYTVGKRKIRIGTNQD